MTRTTILFGLLLLVFGCTNKTKKEFTEEEWSKDYEQKQKGLEKVLGKMHNMVGHAIIPFDAGGTLDMYHFTNGIPGTGFASMELIQPDGTGSVPNQMGTYELVAFTKATYDSSNNHETPFNKIRGRLNVILTGIARYSFEAKLEPKETAELPAAEGQPNYCVLFDDYKPNGQEFKIGERSHGLLLVVEVFRDEMEFAMENGADELIEKLKAKGHYPYSDLDRESVLK